MRQSFRQWQCRQLRPKEVSILALMFLAGSAWLQNVYSPQLCSQLLQHDSRVVYEPLRHAYGGTRSQFRAGQQSPSSEEALPVGHSPTCKADELSLQSSSKGAFLQAAVQRRAPVGGYLAGLLCRTPPRHNNNNNNTPGTHTSPQSGMQDWSLIRLLQQLLAFFAQPLIISWLLLEPYLVAQYTHLLALIAIATPTIHSRLAAAPPAKHALLLALRLQEPVAAALAAVMCPRKVAHLMPFAVLHLPGHCRHFAYRGWFAFMLQVPIPLQLSFGLLEWLLWEVASTLVMQRIGLPSATAAERLLHFTFAYLLPSAAVYLSDGWMLRQYHSRVQSVNSSGSGDSLSGLPGAVAKDAECSTAQGRWQQRQQHQATDVAAAPAGTADASSSCAAGQELLQTSGAAVNAHDSTAHMTNTADYSISNQLADAKRSAAAEPAAGAALSDVLVAPNVGSSAATANSDACAPVAAAVAGQAAAGMAARPRTAAAAGLSAPCHYHSPVVRRTLSIKVLSTGLASHEEAADVMHSTLHAAIAAHPALQGHVVHNMVCVRGCVLLLAEVIGPAAAAASDWQPQQQPECDSVPAFSGSGWNITLPSSSSSSSSSGGSSHVHQVFEHMEEFQAAVTSGALDVALATPHSPPPTVTAVTIAAPAAAPLLKPTAAAAAGPEALAAAGPEELQLPPPPPPPAAAAAAAVPALNAPVWQSPGPSFCVVGEWGGVLPLRLLQPCVTATAAAATQHTEAVDSSSSSDIWTLASGAVRVVMSQSGMLLLDQSQQLTAVAEDASGTRSCLRLQLPSQQANSSEAAVLMVHILQPIDEPIREPIFPAEGVQGCGGASALGAGSSSSESGFAVAAHTGPQADAPAATAAADSQRSTLQPMAHITVLLLPPAAANELCVWVEQQQLSSRDLLPPISDLALLVEARQLLVAARSSLAKPVSGAEAAATAAAAAAEHSSLSPVTVAAATSPESQAVLVQYAMAAADSLVSFLETSGSLPAVADLVAVARQQLLVAASRVQPPAAGALPSEAEAAAMVAAAAANHKTVPGIKKAGFKVAGDTAAAGGEKGSSSSSSGSSNGTTRISGQAVDSGYKGTVPGIPGHTSRLAAGDVAAAAAGGWAGFLLCWQGFKGPAGPAGVEGQYLVFKAGYHRLIDWAGKAYCCLLLPGLSVKHMQMQHWQLWPPVFGLCWILEVLAQALLMVVFPGFYSRYREAWLMGFDVRATFYLTVYQPMMFTPDTLRAVAGGSNKLTLFLLAAQITGMQRAKAALFRWAVVCPATLWQALMLSRPGTGGIEGAMFRAKEAGGWQLMGLCAVYAVLQLLLGMGAALLTDLECRRAFIKQLLQQEQQQHIETE